MLVPTRVIVLIPIGAQRHPKVKFVHAFVHILAYLSKFRDQHSDIPSQFLDTGMDQEVRVNMHGSANRKRYSLLRNRGWGIWVVYQG